MQEQLSEYKVNKRENIKKIFPFYFFKNIFVSATSFPTRTNRLEAVENMKKVLGIHGYKLTGEEA